MTDQTDHDATDEDRRLAREWAESIESTTTSVESTTNPWSDRALAAARVLLAVLPKRPTLADMSVEERAACQWMQADVEGSEDTCVLFVIGTGSAKGAAKDGRVTTGPHECFTPRPDLPRLEWPGDTPTPAPGTLTPGSVWGDIDELTLACETSGRGQIVVADCEGDVSVWSADAGWWESGTPSDGYEPYTILHTGKGGDQ